MVEEPDLVACCACSQDYLAQAIVMLESMRKHNERVKQYLFLVDCSNISTEFNDFFRQKGINVVYFRDFCEHFILDNYIRLSPIEFVTSLKPTILKYCAKLHKDAIIMYCDTDLYFLTDPSPELKNEQPSILLTPHIHIAGDEFMEFQMVRNGIFNAGFLSIHSSQSKGFIEWWENKCRHYCFLEPEEGIFVDQKWLDLVPVLFDRVSISKNKFKNVAYWNINQIKPHEMDAICFLHLSGFDTETFGKYNFNLSRHSQLVAPRTLHPILTAYIEKLNEVTTLLDQFIYSTCLPTIMSTTIEHRLNIQQKQITPTNGTFSLKRRTSAITCGGNLHLHRSPNFIYKIAKRSTRILLFIIGAKRFEKLLGLFRILSRKSTWI